MSSCWLEYSLLFWTGNMYFIIQVYVSYQKILGRGTSLWAIWSPSVLYNLLASALLLSVYFMANLTQWYISCWCFRCHLSAFKCCPFCHNNVLNQTIIRSIYCQFCTIVSRMQLQEPSSSFVFSCAGWGAEGWCCR